MATALIRALTWSGIEPDADMLTRFELFGDWMQREAVAAGGIGPAEADRMDARHLADSVVFDGASRSDRSIPVLDVGSGVGLPGIPLAIARPARPVTLLDRSGRRVALARRAVRVLGLTNVDVVHGDLEDAVFPGRVVVSRAAVPPERWRGVVERRGAPVELLVGGSHVKRPRVPGFEIVDIPPEILDRPLWVLRMAQP
jgi:16S rRNA (guanine527-N7)-methyltransferase